MKPVKVTRYAIEYVGDEGRQFIRQTGGDWGPSSLPTDDLLEALLFDSERGARESPEFREWSGERDRGAVDLELSPFVLDVIESGAVDLSPPRARVRVVPVEVTMRVLR